MNILLTGATGFLGRRLIELSKTILNKEDDLILFTSRNISGFKCILHNNYNYNVSNFLDANVNHVDVVIHLAHFLAECHDKENAAYGNLSSINNTLKILDSLPNIPLNFVYCSSVAVYGTDRYEDIDEDSICLGNGDTYGASKIIIEKLLEEWAAKNFVNLQILRPSHIYGPGDKRKYTIPVWLQAKNRNEPIKLFANPSMYRNCLYIDDCCSAILRAAYLKSSAGVINLVSEHNATMLEIAQLCKKVSGNTFDIEINIAGIDLKKHVGLRFSNNKKYRTLLGEEDFSLEAGLTQEFAYYKNYEN